MSKKIHHVSLTDHARQELKDYLRKGVHATRYEHVRKVRLVEDNLNTHSAGSFYQAFEPEAARGLKGRF